MHWQFTPYLIPIVLSVAVLLGIALLIWQRRSGYGVNWFMALVLAQIIWQVLYALELSATQVADMQLLNRASYLAITAIPVLWLFFVLAYLRQADIRPLRVALFFVVPVLSVLLLWTNDAHHLFHTASALNTDGPLPVLDHSYGPWFWVHAGYSYLVGLASVVVLGQTIWRGRGVARRQAVVLLCCWGLTFIANLLTVFELHPFGPLDLTPFAFTVVSLLIMWLLYRYRLLDLMPAARAQVIESIHDGVIVLDRRRRIVDFNPAAEQLTGLSAADVIGQDAAQVFDELSEIVARYRDVESAQTDFTLMLPGGSPRRYRLDIAPLRDWRDRLTGRVLVLRDVTVVYHAEAALRETERRYQGLFERTSYGLIITDLEDIVQEANRQAAMLLGYPVDALPGMHWRELVAPGEYEASRQLIERLLDDHTLPVYERRFVRRDGSIFPAEINVALIRDASGQPSHCFHLLLDISARKQAEAAQQEGRALAEALRDTAAALTSTLQLDEVLERILDNVGRVVPHDAANIMLMDGGIARVVGRRGYVERDIDQAVLKARYVVAKTPNLLKMAETGQPNAIPDVRLHPGWVRHHHTNWIRSYAGAPILIGQDVIGFLNLDSATPDFYTPAHAERLLLLAGQAAIAIHNARLYGESQERNRKLALLNQLTHIGTATLDLDELTQTLADSAAGIIGGDGCFITFWDAEQQRVIPAAAYGELRDRYRDYTTEPGEVSLTESVLRAGRPLPVRDVFDTPHMSRRLAEGFPTRSALALPLRADDRDLGALLLAFNTPHDFTADEIAWAEQAAELVALAVAKARAYADLQARNNELDAFSHTVAHDLQSPLNLVIGYVALIMEDESIDLPPDAREFLDIVCASANKMSRMIDSLLMLSTLRDAEQVIERVEMGPVAQAAVGRLRAEIAGRGITLHVAPDLPPALGYGPWLEEVFANLISNAIKYIGQDNPQPRISVRGERRDGKVYYAVEDNGIGIAPENQAALGSMFTRFHQGEARGFGLGLSIVLRILRRLNGDLTVTSTPGEAGSPGAGSTFTVILPGA